MKAYFRLFLESIRIIRLYENWFEIVSNHFRADRETTNVTLRSGARYQIHPRSTDMGLIHEIHSENVYQIQKGDIGDDSVVVDIGAHIGVFSVFAARLADNVTVYSFEPEPENFQLLLKNIELNHLGNKIHTINQAVSSTDTPKKLIRSASSVSAHSLFPGKFDENDIKDSVDVSCITLASIFEKHAIKKCDILKLDCEGEEYNILLNAPDDVLAKIVKIVAEYHDGLIEYTHRDLENFLRQHNFQVEAREKQSFPNFTTGFLYAINKLSRNKQ